MKFITVKTDSTATELLAMIRDNTRVNDGVKFADKKGGKPFMHVKEKDGKIRIKCEMMGRPTKDNGFLEGTYFAGKVKEKNGVCQISGIILTAPIYHLIFLCLFSFFIFQCISVGGISPIPIILVIFDVFMFYGEFKKQSLIKRYIFRALKIVYKNKNP